MTNVQTGPQRPRLSGWDVLRILLALLGLVLALRPGVNWLRSMGVLVVILAGLALLVRIITYMWRLIAWLRSVPAENEHLRRQNQALENEVSSQRSQLSQQENRAQQLQRVLQTCKDDLAQAGERLRWQDAKRARLIVEQAASLWGGGDDREPESEDREDDPVYQQLTLAPKLAKIRNQPIVRRLDHVRQLSFAYLTYRSATHTRLAHSLGACRNAELAMTKVFREDRLYTRNGPDGIRLSDERKAYYTRLAKVAAMLHDLGHGPLSHALDIHIGIRSGMNTIKPDREFSKRYIDKYLRRVIEQAEVRPDDVVRLMEKDKQDLDDWMTFIGDLIDSPLDVDRMDYLARDAHMTGLSIGALNMQALIERIVPFREVEKHGKTKVELTFDESAVPYVEQFLYARDVMYILCYEHPEKIVAEQMLGRAFDELVSSGSPQERIDIQELALLTDPQILELILASCGPRTLAYEMAELLMRGVTYDPLVSLPLDLTLASEKRPLEVRRWIKAVSKDQYEKAYLAIPGDWAKELVESAQFDDHASVIVTVPSWSIVNNWMKEGEIRILIREADGTYIPKYVHELSSVLKEFTTTLMRERLKIRVFVHPRLSRERRKALRESAVAFFSQI